MAHMRDVRRRFNYSKFHEVASFGIFRQRPCGTEKYREVGMSMSLPIIILAVICIAFGVFAFSIPLSLLIIPAIGKEAIFYLGIWDPSLATGLILAGILVGILIYLFLIPKKTRSVGVFVGGEDAETLERVTGVEFYDTIKDMKILGAIYRKEEDGTFDIYDGGKKLVSLFTKILQRLHNGVLPTYLVWCLLGMIAMFIILFLR